MVELENAKPILFNTKMVRSILNGMKTQTRRPVKWEPYHEGQKIDFEEAVLDYYNMAIRNMECVLYKKIDGRWNQISKPEKTKYQPGDILYVRETFAKLIDITGDGHEYYEYKADTGNPYPGEWPPEEAKGNPDAPKWKPSIHMPKEAARLFLRVTDVRVERLQKISKDDANAEGYPDDDTFIGRHYFCIDWDAIYKEKGYGWNKNPWVWVIEFKKLEGVD